MKKISKIFLVGIFIIILVVGAEIFLRMKFGLGKTVLFKADDYEYIAIPQQVKRFGNTIYYNQYSQRNKEISKKDSIIAAFFGDSVLNGGAQTDQDSLATNLLSNYWSEKFNKSILALNISAGSWGPDNCFAYLKKYGNFGSKKIVLLVSSHDAYDNMDHKPIVGIHPSYPDKQPLCAISEFITRYLPRYLPKKQKTKDENLRDLGINKRDRNNDKFNTGFLDFYNYCIQNKITLIIFLHAELEELKSKRYNEQGQEIIKFCNDRNIKLIKELDYNFSSSVYRDNIHLSTEGQGKVYEILKDTLLRL